MEYKYSAELMRFKPSGKYYDTVSFGTNSEHMFQISDEIHECRDCNNISKNYHYLLTGKFFDGSDMPNGYPVLIVGEK